MQKATVDGSPTVISLITHKILSMQLHTVGFYLVQGNDSHESVFQAEKRLQAAMFLHRRQ